MWPTGRLRCDTGIGRPHGVTRPTTCPENVSPRAGWQKPLHPLHPLQGRYYRGFVSLERATCSGCSGWKGQSLSLRSLAVAGPFATRVSDGSARSDAPYHLPRLEEIGGLKALNHTTCDAKVPGGDAGARKAPGELLGLIPVGPIGQCAQGFDKLRGGESARAGLNENLADVGQKKLIPILNRDFASLRRRGRGGVRTVEP